AAAGRSSRRACSPRRVRTRRGTWAGSPPTRGGACRAWGSSLRASSRCAPRRWTPSAPPPRGPWRAPPPRSRRSSRPSAPVASRAPPRRSPAGRAIVPLLGPTLAVLVAAFVKGAIGFGFPTLGTPLLALFLDVKTAVAVLVVPNLVMDGIQARRRGGLAATVRRLRPLLLSGAAGTVLGTAALAELGAQTVTLALGGFVVLFVILNAMRVSPRVAPSWERWLSAPVGLVAGVVGGVTNVPS